MKDRKKKDDPLSESEEYAGEKYADNQQGQVRKNIMINLNEFSVRLLVNMNTCQNYSRIRIDKKIM